MITRLYSAAVEGINGYEVEVEVDVRPVEDTGRISVVGLPDAAVRESVQRVTSALSNSSFFSPGDVMVTVNLAPADTRKQGPGFDLPIAVAILLRLGTGPVGADAVRWMESPTMGAVLLFLGTGKLPQLSVPAISTFLAKKGRAGPRM